MSRIRNGALVGCTAALSLAVVEGLQTREPVRSNVAVAAPQVIPIGRMQVERAAHQATVLSGGAVLITGGCAGRGCERVLGSAELYDPETHEFEVAARMATPRSGHASIALADGRVLVVGGWTGRGATASAEVYDPVRRRFTSAGALLEARINPVVASLPNGLILIAGGEMGTGAPLASAEIFDPSQSTFSAVGSMGVPRGGHAVVQLADGGVLVTGGHQARGEILASAEVFDPHTQRFQPVGGMTLPRHKHASVRLLDGSVLVIGGSDRRDARGRYRSTEIYDPGTRTFSPGPEMRWPRYKVSDAVAVLASGEVLIGGGAAGPEIYDPGEGRFLPVQGELSGAHAFATATILRDQTVLILGGYDDRIRPTAEAWAVRSTR